MPRLKMIDPATDTGPGADLLNTQLNKMQINIFKGLAVNANVLKAFVGFSQGVKNAGALTPAEHELVALAASQKRNCDYCLAAHTQMAIMAGVDEEAALQARRRIADNPKHQALIDFAMAVLETGGFVSDEQIDAFRSAGYDDAAIIEVIGQLAVITFTNFFNHLNETEVDFPVPAAV